MCCVVHTHTHTCYTHTHRHSGTFRAHLRTLISKVASVRAKKKSKAFCSFFSLFFFLFAMACIERRNKERTEGEQECKINRAGSKTKHRHAHTHTAAMQLKICIQKRQIWKRQRQKKILQSLRQFCLYCGGLGGYDGA